MLDRTRCSWCVNKDTMMFPRAPEIVVVYGCWVCGYMEEFGLCTKHYAELAYQLVDTPDKYGHSCGMPGDQINPYLYEFGKL